MEYKDNQLDNAAKELYEKLGGVEVRNLKGVSFDKTDRFAQGLVEERRQYDAMRFLLAQLVEQVSLCLHSMYVSRDGLMLKYAFAELQRIFLKFSQDPELSDTTLVRHRGGSGEQNKMDNINYEILFGEIVLDSDVALYMSKHQKTDDYRVSDHLNKAFETFWNHDISNLFMKIPGESQELKRLWISLQLMARYFMAEEKNTPIKIKIGGKRVSFPLVYNERNAPDPNLTLLAILNGLHPDKMQNMVQKADDWMRGSASAVERLQYSSTYDAILGTKDLKKKLIPPPIEINNVKWLMVDSEEHEVSDNMARVARLVMDNSEGSSAETARVLRSVYSDDYRNIGSQQVVKRLSATSGLLDTIEKESEDEEIENEVLHNVEKRLDKVNDEVYDNLSVEGNEVKVPSESKETFIAKLHTKVLNMVTFYKQRSVTKKKMTDMVHQPIYFNHHDFETLAKDFNVAPTEAKKLINMLKNCFDSQGNFRRSVFVGIVPDLERYERRIFEFLWHNLKESLHHKDRPTFLDCLQLLVDRLEQPKNAISVILEDLCDNTHVVRFADRKAFMLGNRLVRLYSQEILGYQITPEDVLMVEKGLDRKIAAYAAWKIDRNQEKFFDKTRTIHRRLMETLEDTDEDARFMDAQELLALEREIYIFCALVGGNTGRSVLVSALKEYGYPESEIFMLRNSQALMADLLQLLKILVRGMGRIKESSIASALNHIKSRLDVFTEMVNSLHEEDLIHQIREHIEESILKITEET